MVESLFLASILGPVCLTVAISLALNLEYFPKVVKEFYKSPALFYSTAFFGLILGVVLVLFHNIWVSDWRVLITIMSWLVLLKSLFAMLFPEFVIHKIKKFAKASAWYFFAIVLYLLVGGVLSYNAFMV